MFLIPIALLILGLVVFIPTLFGTAFTLGSAWGWDFFQPCSDCRLEAFSKLFSHPQFLPSLSLTLRTSLLSAGLSLILVFFIAGGWSRSPGRLARLMPLWLSYPHVAFAIGLVFLISPSGFMVRWIGAPFGIDTPLTWETYQDPFGISLILGLAFKETVFLLFMAFSQMSQIKISAHYQEAMSLGYSPSTAWLKVIWPQIYRGIRFPFFIVLSYSFSAVDMSMILAGKTPPPFATLILQWFQDPDLSYSRVSSAAAIVLIIVFFLTLGGWWLGEKLIKAWMRRLIFLGNRKSFFVIGPRISTALFGIISLTLLLSFLMNGMWSVTRSWPFPSLLPTRYTGQTWNFWEQDLGGIFWDTLSLAVVSALLGLVVAVIVLEMRFTRLAKLSPLLYFPSRTLIFLPLLLPSVSFFISIRIFLLIALPPLNPWLSTVIGHFLMVFPYTLLTLERPYHNFNQKYFVIAQTLSGSNLKSYFRIKFPMLKKPLLSSLAIALSVSLMDYLATAVLSGGMVSTITTEAVQLSAGGHPRIMGFFAVMQTLSLVIVFFGSQIFTSSKPQSMG